MKRRRFVDLSLPIETGLPSDPPMMIPKIDYIDHTQGAEQMKTFFPGVSAEKLPGGLGWAIEFLKASGAIRILSFHLPRRPRVFYITWQSTITQGAIRIFFS